MTTTANGFHLVPEVSGTRKWTLPGTGRHLILAPGHLGFILAHFALWFHEEVERLDTGVWDEWGWSYRPVRGSTSVWSEHAAAVAADLNATRHPMGTEAPETFTRAQVARIRRRLRTRYRGLVEWGAEWGRPDPMHFQLAEDRPGLRALALALAKTPRGRRILKANPGAVIR